MFKVFESFFSGKFVFGYLDRSFPLNIVLAIPDFNEKFSR